MPVNLPDTIPDNKYILTGTQSDRLSGNKDILSDSLSERTYLLTDNPPDNLSVEAVSIDPATEQNEVKTWTAFFKMVGIDALTATEAQKRENIDIRTKQVEAGVLVAKDKGLGEWEYQPTPRKFVRVDH